MKKSKYDIVGSIIAEAYIRLKSVYSVSKELNIPVSSVQYRCNKLGILAKRWPRGARGLKVPFTKEDEEKMLLLYEDYASRAKLDELVKIFGRSKTFLYWKAKELGIPVWRRKSHERKYEYSDEAMSRLKERWSRTVPPSHKGHRHTKETKEAMVKSSKDYYNSVISDGTDSIRVQKILKTKMERYGSLTLGGRQRKWKTGYRTVGGKTRYFRSTWEANYARFLGYKLQSGEISAWEHEVESFWFEDKTYTHTYLPDFKVWFNDGHIEYHEVKGWLDARSQSKIDKMAKEYPAVKLIIILENWFREHLYLEKTIPDWEKMNF